MATGGILLNGTTQYLELSASVLTSMPCSFVIWSSYNANQNMVSFNQSQSNADRYVGVFLDGNGTSKYASWRNPGGGPLATKSSAPHPNNTSLQIAVAVFTSTTSRTMYYGDATPSTIDTTACTDDMSSHDRVTIGALHYNSSAATAFHSGVVAEVHMFNRALTSSDVTTLLTTAPENVTGWVDGWKLSSNTDLTSIGGTRTLTAVGSPTTASLTLPYTRAAAPVLSAASAAATGNGTASGAATTTGTDGTLYAVRSAAQPTNAQIVAGQDSTGAATSAGILAITSAGAKTIPLTGVAVPTGSQTVWFLHRPAAGAASDSNVISAAWTQPAALAWAGTYPAQSGTAGAAFTHSGTIPTPTGGVGTKTYSATGLGASGLTINTSTGQLQGTCGTAGTYTITPTVTDSSTAGTPNPQTASLASFTLTISAGGGGGGGTAPSISSHPASQSVTEGATATFSVTASGSGTLTYQWRKNGTNISGATASSYTTPATVLADSGALFSVVVTGDTSPPATSNNATLTVNAATGTYTAQTDIIGLAGIAQASTLMYWTWFPSGRPGGMASGVNGSGTTDTAGRLTISHTVAGQGLVIVGTRPGPAVANDRVYAQFLTLA